jgi:hypothetical protein
VNFRITPRVVAVGLTAGLLGALGSGLPLVLLGEPDFALSSAVLGGLLFGMAGLLVSALSSGLGGIRPTYNSPNEGVRRSLRFGSVAGVVSLLVGLVATALLSTDPTKPVDYSGP